MTYCLSGITGVGDFGELVSQVVQPFKVGRSMIAEHV